MKCKKCNLNFEEVFEFYLTHTIYETAKYFDISTASLQRFLRENNGVKNKKEDFVRTKLKGNKEEIIELLKTNTHKQIADKLGISIHNLRGYIRRYIDGKFSDHGILDENIDFNDPIFWYFVGMVLSDGHLSSIGYSVNLYSKYAYHIAKLKDYFKSSGNLRKGQIYTATFTNKVLHDFFTSNGIESDKRYNAKLILPEDDFLKKCLIAGLFDGDGCIFYNYTSGMFTGNQVFFSSGSRKLIEELLNILHQFGFENFTMRKERSNVGNNFYRAVTTNKKTIVEFFDFLYPKEIQDFRLNQKYVKYLKFIALLEIDKKYGW